MNKNTINLSNGEIPTSIQSDYIAYHRKIDIGLFDEKETLRESDKLFQQITHIEEKRRILFLLAHVKSEKALKIFQKYLTVVDKELTNWAYLAFQECKQHLLGDGILISTGAGGQGDSLRFYFVISTLDNTPLTDKQKEELQCACVHEEKLFVCILENTTFESSYAILTVLIPFDIAPATYVESILDKCKLFLRYHYFCSNVNKPTTKEIQEYLDYVKKQENKL